MGINRKILDSIVLNKLLMRLSVVIEQKLH